MVLATPLSLTKQQIWRHTRWDSWFLSCWCWYLLYSYVASHSCQRGVCVLWTLSCSIKCWSYEVNKITETTKLEVTYLMYYEQTWIKIPARHQIVSLSCPYYLRARWIPKYSGTSLIRALFIWLLWLYRLQNIRLKWVFYCELSFNNVLLHIYGHFSCMD